MANRHKNGRIVSDPAATKLNSKLTLQDATHAPLAHLYAHRLIGKPVPTFPGDA